LFFFLQSLFVSLFIISFLGYIATVLIEKKHKEQNIIIIDNKHLSQEDIQEVDIKEFIFRGKRLGSGDEIKVKTKGNQEFNGTIIGAKRSSRAIHIITTNNEVLKLEIENILDFKIISKYGKFFNN